MCEGSAEEEEAKAFGWLGLHTTMKLPEQLWFSTLGIVGLGVDINTASSTLFATAAHASESKTIAPA